MNETEEEDERQAEISKFTKEIYDRLTNLFTKMGFKYKGHEHAYDLLTDARASLERGYDDWVHSSSFVNDLMKSIESLVGELSMPKSTRWAVITGAFDESGCDRWGPESLIVKTFPNTPNGSEDCMKAYLKYAFDLENDCKGNEEFKSSHDLHSTGIWNVSLDDEIRCGRVLKDSGLHTGFAMIKEVEDA
jgi:hypothetical protein